MKITFIQDIPITFMGVMHLSSMLKLNGHKTSAIITSEHSNYMNAIEAEKPDVAGFPCMTGVHTHLLQIASIVKKKLKIPVIFGGPHPTHYAKIIEEPQVDAICIGEGEEALVELLDAWENGGDDTKILNIWVKRKGKIFQNLLRPLVQNLDSLPFPDRVIYKKYSTIQTEHSPFFRIGRGCPYNCSYCLEPIKRKQYRNPKAFVRLRSHENLIEEILSLKQQSDFRFLTFIDDCFNSDLEWMLPFLEKYKEYVKIPFHCQGVFENFTSEVVKALKQAGCYSISSGVESADLFIRKKIIHKNTSLEVILSNAKIIKENGILLKIYNQLGFPEETAETAMKTLKFNIDINPTSAWTVFFQPYPETIATEYALRNGFLPPDYHVDKIGRSARKKSILMLRQKKEIVNIEKLFVAVVRFPKLFPLVRYVIKIPNNPVFDLIHLISYSIQVKVTEGLTLTELIRYGIKIFKAKA